MSDTADIVPGTLEMLILKAVSLGSLHGYGVLLRIEQITGHALTIEQGSLYPALHRLEHRGLLEAEWGRSDNNRRAKFYRLTPAGTRRLKEDRAGWDRFTAAVAAALDATPEEI
jgi:transcriptional regulator